MRGHAEPGGGAGKDVRCGFCPAGLRHCHDSIEQRSKTGAREHDLGNRCLGVRPDRKRNAPMEAPGEGGDRRVFDRHEGGPFDGQREAVDHQCPGVETVTGLALMGRRECRGQPAPVEPLAPVIPRARHLRALALRCGIESVEVQGRGER